MPRPRYDRLVSARIAAPAPSVTETNSGDSEFGMMWRKIRRDQFAPTARAASLKSWVFSESVIARVIRVPLNIDRMIRMRHMVQKPGGKILDSTIRMGRSG